jgi:hypothetical protein
MPKTHYQSPNSAYAACGAAKKPFSQLSTDPGAVDCKACRMSMVFRKRHPELSLERHKAGRKPSSGIAISLKFYPPPELHEWLKCQNNQAETIVLALQQWKDSQGK